MSGNSKWPTQCRGEPRATPRPAMPSHGLGHGKGWPRLGGQAGAAGDWAGERCAQREGGGVQTSSETEPLVTWVGCVGGGPRWGRPGQWRLITVLRPGESQQIGNRQEAHKIPARLELIPQYIILHMKITCQKANSKSWDSFKVLGTSYLPSFALAGDTQSPGSFSNYNWSINKLTRNTVDFLPYSFQENVFCWSALKVTEFKSNRHFILEQWKEQTVLGGLA